MDLDSYPIVWLLLSSLFGLAIVVAWASFRWSGLKPALFPIPDKTEQVEEEADGHVSRGMHVPTLPCAACGFDLDIPLPTFLLTITPGTYSVHDFNKVPAGECFAGLTQPAKQA
jgi:hypothetical protein